MTDHHIDQFRSPTIGLLSLTRLVDRVVEFIEKENNSHFKIVIGTDSEITNGHTAHFVSAIVVHHVGHGGVYFWGQVTKDGIKDLRQRMYEERAEDIHRLITDLRGAGYQIVSVEQTDQSVDFTKAKYERPVALIFGHERTGVEDDLLEKSDLIVHIPMLGMGNSHNVAMSAAIVSYHILSQ